MANDFNNYHILGCQLQYLGVCPQCQNRQPKSKETS
jgi:hypothetical protein